LTDQPGVTASVYLPGSLIAPPAEIVVDTPEDPRADSFGEVPLRTTEHGSELDGRAVRTRADEVRSPATTPTRGSDTPVRDGSALPKRSPGASGVNGVARPEDGPVSAELAAATEDSPAPQATSNTFAYFNTRPTPEAPTSQAATAAEPARPNIASESSEGAPIYERMVSEWLMDPTTLESRDGVWATPADAGWTAAAKAVEQKPQRHTESGLPIRERGARLVPGHARNGSDAGPDVGRDPAAVGDMLSRAMAGIRSGRAESTAAHRRTEGDR
jgi:hypothetical protein